MKVAMVTILMAAAVVCGLEAQNTQTPNVSGTWQIEYHDKNGKEVDTPMVTFLQTGGRLEGVFGNQHWRIEGTLVGTAVKFSFHPPQKPEITVAYQGALESPSLIRGTMASQVQSGTFTATRK